MFVGIGLGATFLSGLLGAGVAALPSLITQPPSLFWPINTAQSYNIAQHVTGPGPITYTTADALPAGVTLSSAGVLSGTPTTIVTGFIGILATAPNGSTLLIPVFLAIQDVPAAFVAGQWALVPTLSGFRVDISTYPADNNSTIIKAQYRLDAGSAADLPVGGGITTTGTHSVEIRAVNAIGAGAWSDVKSDTALTPTDWPTFRQDGAVTTQTTATTALSIAAYASRVVGDTLIHEIGIADNPSYTVPAGWTTLANDLVGTVGTPRQRSLIVTRDADGTSADDFTMTLGAAQRYGAKSWCGVGKINYALSAVAALDALGQSANPPSLTIPSGVQQARFLAMIVHSGSGTAVSVGAAPTNYAYDGGIASTGSTSVHVRVHAAYREYYSASDDPAAFGQSVDRPATYTMAMWKGVVAPVLTAPIADQTLEQNTGGGSVNVASAFTGTGITYGVSGGPTGTTINSSGVVAIPTTTVGTWTITVSATNAGGGPVNDSFDVTVNAASIPSAVFTSVGSVVETFADGTESAGMNFVDAGGAPTNRMAAQSVTGRWHVLGDAGNPVRMTPQRLPVFEDGITRYHQGNSTAGTVAGGNGRYRNGMMLNPTIIRDTVDLVDPGITRTTTQGFDSYMYQSGMGTPHSPAANIYSGSPLAVSNGVVVQSVGLPFTSASDPAQVGGKTTFRTRIVGHFGVAVIPSAPPQNFFAIPPSGADKTLFFGLHTGMVKLNLLPADDLQTGMPGRKTFRELVDTVKKMKNSWSQDQDRSRSMMAEDERLAPYGTTSVEDDYSRELAKRHGACLVAAIKRQPTSGDDSTAWRNQLVYHLVQDGLDYAAALLAGEDYPSGGGFQTGIKSVVAFAAIMLDLQWLKDLCDPARVQPVAGTPIYRDSADTTKGSIGYGFAEHKRYFVVPTALRELSNVYYPNAGRGYPKPYQTGHVGLPDWAEFGHKEGSGYRHCPNWDYQYRENCMSDMMGMIAVHMITGMSAIFRQDYILQYFDRAVAAKRTGKMRSESGASTQGMWVYDTYRLSTSVSYINLQPDQPEPPVLTQFVGEGARLGVRLSASVFSNSSGPITSYDIRYRTTQPDRFLETEAGWTVVSGVSLSLANDYFLTGLSPSTTYWVQIRAVNANGTGAWSTNLRKNTSARTSAEAYLVPRSTAATSTNQNVANTAAPFIVGGVSVGQELAIDHGVWSIQPTGYTYQWKRNGTNISGATARTYTVVSGDIGATITCDVNGANSSSNLTVTTTGRVATAAVTRSLSVLGAATKFDTSSSTGNRTRTVTFGSALSHPKTVSLLFGLAPDTSDSDAIPTLRAEIRDAAATAYSATTGTNEVTAAKSEAVSGNKRTGTRFFSIPTTAAGGDRVSVNVYLSNLYDLRVGASTLTALDLAGYDLSAAMFGGFRDFTDSTDVTLYDGDFDAVATIGIAADGSGVAQIVPKGSLLLAVLAAGPHHMPITPVWSDGMTDFPGATATGLMNAKSATVAAAQGIQAAAGSCTVTCTIGGNPERVAMSLIAIPPL